MSGHSKWAKIKRQKGVNDVRRGNLFTKLAKNITDVYKRQLQGLSAAEGDGIPRVAVKCVDMRRNTDGEGNPLDLY